MNSGTARIAVLGHYGQRNLGDESIIAAAIDGIRQARPGCRVICISHDPADARARHGVDGFPIRPGTSRTPERPPSYAKEESAQPGVTARLRRAAARIPPLRLLYRMAFAAVAAARAVAAEIAFIRRNRRTLDSVEAVVVAGSNQLADNFGGAWGFPYTLLRWAMLARWSGATFNLVSVGAGPLEGWLSKQMVLCVLRCADYVSVRDPGSARLLQGIGWRRPVPVRPDLAFGFARAASRRHGTGASARSPAGGTAPLTIGINLMPIHDERYWPNAEREIRKRYLEALTGFVTKLAANGHLVSLFGTQPADEWVAEDLLEALQSSGGSTQRVRLVRIRELEELTDLYAGCDAVVATRFHGILLALRFSRPVIGIAYYRKSRELMDSFGLGRFALDVDTLSAEALERAFQALIRDPQGIEQAVRAGITTRESELSAQYRAVLTEESSLRAVERKA